MFFKISTLKSTFTVSIITHCPNRPKSLSNVFVLMEANVHFQLLNQFCSQILFFFSHRFFRSFQRIYYLASFYAFGALCGDSRYVKTVVAISLARYRNCRCRNSRYTAACCSFVATMTKLS